MLQARSSCRHFISFSKIWSPGRGPTPLPSRSTTIVTCVRPAMIAPIRQVVVSVPKTMVVRCFAAAAQATDPIQKLFVDKIREYSAKAKSAPNGLVDSNAELIKKLNEDVDRVANMYGIKNEKEIANLGLKFEDTTPLDPINMGARK